MRSILQLMLAAISVAAVAFKTAAAQQDLQCITHDICRDESTGGRIKCMEVGFECCTFPDDELRLVKYQRGISCCHGAGLYDIQTHTCDGTAIINRPQTTLCPKSETTFYNFESQTCCRGRDSIEPTVHFMEENGACCGSEYVIYSIQGCCDGVPYNKETQCCKDFQVAPIGSCNRGEIENDGSITCAALDFCKDGINREIFKCVSRNYGCCNMSDGIRRLFNAPRGTECCEGAGMYHIQTHDCVSGRIEMKAHIELCPGSKTYFDNQAEICCYNDQNVPIVHTKEARHSCCGHSYIHNDIGCCDGIPYDKATSCCQNNRILSKEYCQIIDPDCPAIDCSQRENDALKSSKPKQLFACTLQAGRLLKTDKKYRYYKVADVKLLKGARHGKVTPVSSKRIRKIAIPKCGCSSHVPLKGQHYILMSQTRMRSTVRLRTGEYTLTAVENSPAF